MVFGTFDGLHEGHRYFLNEAKKLGDYLIVAVAHDSAVHLLKNKAPRQDAAARVSALLFENLADEVVVGDEKQGSWEVLKRHTPDIIALGHDQHELCNSLEPLQKEFGIELVDVSLLKREI